MRLEIFFGEAGANMSIESNFFGALFKSGDWKSVTERQITPTYFEGEKRKAFKWLEEFAFEYGQLPSVDEFKKKFPKVEMTETEDPMAYHCDELRRKKRHNTIVDSLEAMKKNLDTLATDEAYNIMKDTVLEVETNLTLTKSFKIEEDIQSRYDRYIERKNAGGIVGIPTGIDPLDYMLGGIKPVDLVTFYGFTNTGKSWLLIIMAVAIAKLGYKVLFLTKEMSSEQLGDRIDAVWSGISYNRLRSGNLSLKEEDDYVKYLNKIETEDVTLVVEEVKGGVLACASLIDTHKPDICFIDGGYLMVEDTKDGDDWRGIVKVWRNFKEIAMQKKVPVVATTQLKSQDARLDNASFAKAIANECDSIFSLTQDEQERAQKIVTLTPLKLRDGEITKAFKMNWDFVEMDWSLLYVDNVKEGPLTAKKELKKVE